MKSLFVGVALLTLVSQSFAHEIVRPERVTVKHVELVGDFMPPLPPGSSELPAAVLTVQVDSSGCTDEASFRVDKRVVAGGLQLKIVRIRPDICRAFFPEGTEVKLTVPDVGFTDNLFIANPMRVVDNTTH